MAKLKAPLMSLGATGQLGKSIVFFPWKGLDVVREYIIPTNPKSDAQVIQRDYLKDAVTAIHAAQADAILTLGPKDITAYALWGSSWPTPRTWFNTIVKNWVDQRVANKKPAIYVMGVTVAGSKQLGVAIKSQNISTGNIVTGNFYYGTSKTALTRIKAATMDLPGHNATATINGLAAGTKYYWQFRPVTLADYVGALSGIYHGTPTA